MKKDDKKTSTGSWNFSLKKNSLEGEKDIESLHDHKRNRYKRKSRKKDKELELEQACIGEKRLRKDYFDEDHNYSEKVKKEKINLPFSEKLISAIIDNIALIALIITILVLIFIAKNQ